MRKFVKLILAIFIILNILLSSNSYAICNTVRADNRVTAVRLTLQNGQILHEFTVDEKDVVSPDGTLDNVQIQNAKKLELIFIVDTDTSDLNAEKSIVENAIGNFANFYKNDTSKLNIGIIGFDNNYKNYTNSDDFNYQLKNYASDSSTIQNELDNLSSSR